MADDLRTGEGSLAEAMQGLMDELGRAGMSDAARAGRAWDQANGDRERAHTCGVYLQRSRRPGADPRLVVYVDTTAWVTELSVNKDLYLARLANVGLAVSGVDFRLSRTPKRRRDDPKPKAAPKESVRRPLTALERAEAEDLLARAPEALRDRIRPSLEASLAREGGEP